MNANLTKLKVGDRVRHVDALITGTVIREANTAGWGPKPKLVVRVHWDGHIEPMLVPLKYVERI